MRIYQSVFISLILLVSANAKLSPKLTNLKEGWTLVPSRLGIPIPVNVAKLLANPQPFFDVNSDVKFDLYTLKNKEEPQVLVLGDVESIKSSNFNKSLPTRIYVHGWQEHGSTMKNMFNDAYFNKAKVDVNLIAVNWERSSKSLDYAGCAIRVEAIGSHLASMIDFMVVNELASLEDITLIGFSLGAHIVGIAGKQLQSGKLTKIVGLDPAAPLFSLDKPHKRLDELDAKYVEIIHTSSTWLGLSEPIGTTNFYPNHGKSQLGCRLDPTGTCSHLRAYKYFAESIYSNVSFYGYPCDTLDDMKESKCKGVGARMGGEPGNYRTEARIYFLETNSKPIYARGGSRDMN